MANPFDQFDKKETNPFDQFDKSSAENPAPEKESEQDSIGRAVEQFAGSEAGFLEPAATIISGGIAEPIAGLRGLYELATGADSSEASKAIEETRRALTYEPRTEAGKEGMQTLAQGIESAKEFAAPVVEPVASAMKAPIEQTGRAIGQIIGAHPFLNVSPETAEAIGQTMVATAPTAAAELLGARFAGGVAQPELPAYDLFEESGIRQTLGEATGDFGQRKQERFLEERTSGAGEQMRQFRAEQSREIDKYLKDAADIEGFEPSQTGAAIKEALDLRKDSARYKRNKAYDQLANLTKDLDFELSTISLENALPTKRDLKVFENTNSGQFNALQGALQDFGVISGGIDVEKLNVANYEGLRKILNNIEKSDQTGQSSVIIGPIRSALDQEFEDATKSLESNGMTDIARAAKNARQSHVALKTEFDEKGMVDKLVADQKGSRLPKIQESQIYDKLASKSTPVEEFDRVIKSLDRAASKGKRAKDNLKAQMMLDVIDSGFAAKTRKFGDQPIFGAIAFQKRFDQLEPKLKSVLTPAEFNKVKKFRDNSDRLIPSGSEIPKGSAGFLVDLIKASKLSALPAAGPFMADQLTGLISAAGDAAKIKKAMEKPKTRQAAEFLARQYPALAATIGVSSALNVEESIEEE